MGDAGRTVVRAAGVVLFVALALVELRTLALLAYGQARAAERWVAPLRAKALVARPTLEALLATQGPNALLDEARRRLVAPGPHLLLDSGGLCVASQPAVACGPDPLFPRATLASSPPDGTVVVGPTAGTPPRLFFYMALPRAKGNLYLRVTLDGAGLADDVHDRRRLFLLHAVALALVVLIAALLLLPQRGGAPPDAAALSVYEVAMQRLTARGSERARSLESEVHRLQLTLHDREAMARAGELTAGIVHEVRNGLGTLSGYARLLERSVAGPEAAGLVAALRDECATLEGVVRRIADFVKSEELHPAPFDVRRSLERVVARENRRPGPEAALIPGEPLTLVGDEDLLERAFENLVRNAREAAGPQGTVRLEARGDEGAVVVVVADDGPGLPEELQSGARPFLTTKPGGLGLGLSTALKMVALHGGRLDLVPAAPRGLLAVLRLPSPVPPAGSRPRAEPSRIEDPAARASDTSGDNAAGDGESRVEGPDDRKQ